MDTSKSKQFLLFSYLLIFPILLKNANAPTDCSVGAFGCFYLIGNCSEIVGHKRVFLYGAVCSDMFSPPAVIIKFFEILQGLSIITVNFLLIIIFTFTFTKI